MPAYVLAIARVDLIVGVSWLRKMGPHMIDYEQQQLRFYYDDKFITWKGLQQLPPTNVICTQLYCSCSTNAISECYTRQILPTMTASLGCASSTILDDIFSNLPATTSPDISHILQKYKVVFSIPTSLPPLRPCNHHILLQPNNSLVKVMLYRYPHSQKAEIELMFK